MVDTSAGKCRVYFTLPHLYYTDLALQHLPVADVVPPQTRSHSHETLLLSVGQQNHKSTLSGTIYIILNENMHFVSEFTPVHPSLFGQHQKTELTKSLYQRSRRATLAAL